MKNLFDSYLSNVNFYFMAEVVNRFMEILGNHLDKDLMEESDMYIDIVSEFVRTMKISQGDYEIIAVNHYGLPIVSYGKSSKKDDRLEELNPSTEEILRKAMRKGNRQRYITNVKRLLGDAIGDGNYRIEVEDYAGDRLKAIYDEIGEDGNSPIAENTYYEILLLNNIKEVEVEIFLDNQLLGKLTGSISGKYAFDLAENNIHSLSVMECIGDKIFHCSKDEIEFNLDTSKTTTKIVEEQLQEIINWE